MVQRTNRGARSRTPRVVILATVLCMSLSSCALRVSHDAVVTASQGRAGLATTDVPAVTDSTTDVGGAPATTPTSGAVTSRGPGAVTGPGRGATTGSGTSGAPAGGATAASPASQCKGSGTIVIGNVAPYGASAVGQNYAPGRDALKVWEADVNARGGICGRRVQVITMDDAGNASKTSAYLRDMVENKHAVAIVGWGTAFTLQAGLGYLESKRVPVIGGDLLTMAWSSSPVLFPQGAGFDEIIYGSLTGSKLPTAANKLALLYCAEAQACTDAYDLVGRQGIAKAAGTPLVYSAKASLTAVSFASECQQAKAAGADIMLIGGDASFVERIANSCAQQGISFRYTSSAAAVAGSQDQNPNFQNGNFSVATPVIPWPSTASPGAKAYSAAYHRYYPDLDNSGMAIAYWTAAKLAEEIITRIGSGAVTTASVLASAEQVKSQGLNGLTGPLTFHGGANGQGSPRCWATAEVRNNHWTARNNGAFTCRSGAPLTREGSGLAN